jgi:beta-phosphoglucomutase
MNRPFAIVFDFDGVLADTEPLHMRALQQVLGEAGLPITEADYYERYLGYDDVGLVAKLAEDRAVTLSQAQLHELVTRKAELMPALLSRPGIVFPGAIACVRRLAADLPLAIASGALRPEIVLVLSAAGLRECFHDIVASGETPRSKPAPDPYERAVALLQSRGLVPRRADAASGSVAIEDSRWGLASARAAGLRAVAVTTSYDASAFPDADLVVASLDDIDTARLSALFNGTPAGGRGAP